MMDDVLDELVLHRQEPMNPAVPFVGLTEKLLLVLEMTLNHVQLLAAKGQILPLQARCEDLVVDGMYCKVDVHRYEVSK